MASGILASSSPLVETVNNQQSPNQGVRVSMKDGGIAKFQNGGFTSFPSQTVVPDLTTTSKRIASYLSGYGLGRQPFKLVSEEAVNIMDPDLRKRRERIFPEFRRPGGEGSPPGGRLQRGLYTLAKGAQDLASGMYGASDAVARFLTSPFTEEKGYSIGQVRTISELIRKRPDLEDTIISSADNAIQTAEDRSISGDELADQIGLGVSMKLENLENLLDPKGESEDVSETEIQALFREGPPGASGPSPVPGVSDVEGLVESSENVSGLAEGLAEGPPDDPESFESAEKKETTAEKIRKEVTQEPGLTNEEREILADLRPERKPPIEGKGTPETAAETIVKTFDKPDMSEKEATKTIADYKEEFLKEMPEYEGMSEEEKGFALMEAGLRVAAGESPNAITNIAKGLKGIGDTFAKDKKEKRAWDRQVDLSATKYALQKVNVDRDRLKAFQEKEKDIVQVMNPDTGDVKIITKADLRTGNIPKGYLTTKDPYGDFIKGVKATKALIDAQAKLKGKNEITSKWVGQGEKYTQNAQKVLDSVQSKNLLGPAIEILYDPDIPITGIQGIMTQSWNRFSNAFGLSANDTIAKKGEAKEKYISRVQQVIAKKITAILGESNRTISTPDRERADQIAGVFANYLYDPLVKDPDVLKQKIKQLWTTLDNDEKLGAAEMNRIVESVGTLTVPGGGKTYADVLRDTGRRILGTRKGIGPQGKVRKLSDFGSFDSKGVFR
jgi:hypothetical protein